MGASTCSCRYFTASVVAAAVGLLLLGNIGGIVSIISIFEDCKIPNYTDYGVVIDAGSSHSTLWVFSWNGQKLNNTGEIDRFARIRGNDVGIDHYVDNATAAAESISRLVTRADAIVGEVKNRTWLYLGATAGMRLLRKRNKTASEAIMDAIQKVLMKSSFRTRSATIISGLEEANSSWTSVNYLNQALQTSKQTVGSIDFGGASLELAFESVNYTQDVELYYHNHTLYVHSYLCYGRDQMELRLLANLAQSVTKGSQTVENPCLPQGFQMNRTVDTIWSIPCVTAQPPPLNGSELVFFNGTSDNARCAEEVEQLFPNVSCSNGTCGINGTFQPLVKGTFFALGLFKVIPDSLPQLQSSSDHDWDLFNVTVQSWCGSTLTELNALHPGAQDDHTAELCFDGHLMWTTLITGLNFSRTSASNWTVVFASKINTVPLGWPLGYMTQQTSSIFANDNPYGYDRAFSLVDLMLSIVLLSLVAIILALLFIATVRVCLLMKPQAHGGYTPL